MIRKNSDLFQHAFDSLSLAPTRLPLRGRAESVWCQPKCFVRKWISQMYPAKKLKVNLFRCICDLFQMILQVLQHACQILQHASHFHYLATTWQDTGSMPAQVSTVWCFVKERIGQVKSKLYFVAEFDIRNVPVFLDGLFSSRPEVNRLRSLSHKK